MKRICLLLLVSVLVTLMLAPVCPIVNSSPTLNPDSEQAQGWPLPPKPKGVWSAGEDLMAQGWPLPPKPKGVWSAGEDVWAQG